MVGGAFEVNRVVFDGEHYNQFMQGQKAPENAADTQDAAIKSLAFPELSYKNLGITTTLRAIEKVDESYAYVVDVVYPTGTKSTDYYDTESGLKVRQTSYVQGPQGEIAQAVDYQDYAAVDGILFPHTMMIPLGGPMKMTATVESIAVNKGVDESLFKIE